MGTKFARGRMIGQYGNGYRFVPILHSFIDRANSTAIQVFNCKKLQRNISFMSRLITGFDMEIDEVIRLQCFQCSCHFVFIIRIIKSGCSFYRNAAKSGIVSDSIYQIDRRNNSSSFHLRESIGKGIHLRTVSRAPGPDTIGRVFAFGHTFQVQRMILQQFLRL